jgi:DNA-binding MarR family transcriptional regulator
MAGSGEGAGVPEDVRQRFISLSRELSAATVLFHTQIAGRVGLSATDHKCLDLAVRADGPLTAGQIAELSGLSTGAVTGVIDRLERAGYVRRVRDPEDRRKVLVEVSRANLSKYGDAFEGVGHTLGRVLDGYTPEELAVVERYLTEVIMATREETARLTK